MSITCIQPRTKSVWRLQQQPDLVPGPEVEGALGVLCSDYVVPPQEAECVWAAGVVLEGGQVRSRLHVPADQFSSRDRKSEHITALICLECVENNANCLELPG